MDDAARAKFRKYREFVRRTKELFTPFLVSDYGGLGRHAWAFAHDWAELAAAHTNRSFSFSVCVSFKVPPFTSTQHSSRSRNFRGRVTALPDRTIVCAATAALLGPTSVVCVCPSTPSSIRSAVSSTSTHGASA